LRDSAGLSPDFPTLSLGYARQAPGTSRPSWGPRRGWPQATTKTAPGIPGAVSDTQRYFALFARLGLTQIAHTESVQSSEGPPTMRPAWAIQPTFDTG